MDVWNTPSPARGTALLARHCAAISRLENTRPSAVDRLEQLLGVELTRLLVAALAGDHRMRPHLLAA